MPVARKRSTMPKPLRSCRQRKTLNKELLGQVSATTGKAKNSPQPGPLSATQSFQLDWRTGSWRCGVRQSYAMPKDCAPFPTKCERESLTVVNRWDEFYMPFWHNGG